jgi:hypothetical protein
MKEHLWSVFWAYVIGWGVFFIYYVTVARRTSQLKDEIERLKNSVNKSK